MGERKKRRDALLGKPCIFCAGENSSTTTDHQPPRVFFVNRQWPEGYEFPACRLCNQDTRITEKRLGLIVRLDPTLSDNSTEFREARELMQDMHQHDPTFMAQFKKEISYEEAARILNGYGIEYERDDHGQVDLPIVSFPTVLARDLNKYFEKLGKALHYKHTQQIVPKTAGFKVHWETNATIAESEVDAHMIALCNGLGLTQRNRKSLHDQFVYRYEASENGNLGAYLVKFRFTLSVSILIAFDGSLLKDNRAIS
jgi:hypothetical protein